ncbi:MAG: zinc-ribbon domain-containing protein [Armatimonadota bacterium]|jgi:hypothetical protein
MKEPDSRRREAAENGRTAADSDEARRDEPHLICHNCGAEVPEGVRSCPVCRRGAYRRCFCGWQIPVNEPTCSNCGADWSQSARVARKTKSSAARRRELLRYAGFGAAAAVVLAILAYGLVTTFATLAVDRHESMPSQIGERLGLAASGVGELLARFGGFLARHGQTLLLILGVMVVGAAAGVAAYMMQRKNRGRHSSRTSRRVRRKRRTQER